MKVLALTRYGRLGASSRVRFFQYLPMLKDAGVDVAVRPLFSDAYVRGLQQQRRSPLEISTSYLERLRQVLTGKGYDLIWIEKELWPWLPLPVERALSQSTCPIVLDYDDAVFHSYDQHGSRVVRALLGRKHPGLMRRASLVLAGNEYIAEFAAAARAPRVEILPSVVDLERYPLSTPAHAEGVVRGACVVGWVGQQSTGHFLRPLAGIFGRIASDGLARFEALGIDAASLGLPMHSQPWVEATETTQIAKFGIGVMPLPDAPFERGKCGYKLIQYMAAGIPVVASPVGVNKQIVEHGVNGFLAETEEDWDRAIRTLAGNARMREEMGAAGRSKVERRYSLQVAGPTLVRLLREAYQARRS
jgi:hypothetical protein